MSKSIRDFEAYITRNEKVNEEYYLLSLTKPADLVFDPGQFVNIKIAPRNTEPLLRRPFSVFSDSNGEFAVLYQVKGKGTDLLARQSPGNRLMILGPLGTTFPFANAPAIFIGGGIGIAPVLFAAERHAALFPSAERHLLSGMRNQSFMLPESILGTRFTSVQYAFDKPGSVIPLPSGAYIGNAISALSDDKSSFSRVLDSLPPLSKSKIEPITETTVERTFPVFYVCGPDPMLKAFIGWNETVRYSAWLSLESFMGCGFHACLGCAVAKKEGGYLYVCHDGPVVSWDSVSL